MRSSLILVALVAGLAAGPAGAEGPQPSVELSAFLDGFARAVAAHRWDEVVACFEADYVMAQRDDLLAGRTGQFLVEGLGLAASCPGYTDSEKRAFACLKRVRSARLLELVPSPGDELPALVRFEVVPKRGEEPVTLELALVPGPSHGGGAVALAGAVG